NVLACENLVEKGENCDRPRLSGFVPESGGSVRRKRSTVQEIIWQTTGARPGRAVARETTGGLQPLHSPKSPGTDQGPEHQFRSRPEMRIVSRTPERQGDHIEHHRNDGSQQKTWT